MPGSDRDKHKSCNHNKGQCQISKLLRIKQRNLQYICTFAFPHLSRCTRLSFVKFLFLRLSMPLLISSKVYNLSIQIVSIYPYIFNLYKAKASQVCNKLPNILLSVTFFQELKRVDLDRFWNPLMYIDNILSETKEASWLTCSINSRGEAYILERRLLRGVFMENFELNDFPLDVQVSN